MARLNAPCLSLGANGQVAKTLIFSSYRGMNTVKAYKKPADPKTTAQIAQRGLMETVHEMWLAISVWSTEKEGWRIRASQIAPFWNSHNAFFSAAMTLAGYGLDQAMKKNWTSISGQFYRPTLRRFDDAVLVPDGLTWYLLAGASPDAMRVAATTVWSANPLTFTLNAEWNGFGAAYMAVQTDGPGGYTHWKSGITAEDISSF